MSGDRPGMTSGDPLWSGYGDRPVPPGAGGPPPVFGERPAAGRYELASWGARVVATIIDNVILAVLAAILFLPLGAVGLSVDTDAGLVAFGVSAVLFALVLAVAALFYAPILMARWNGQTLGRKAVGITVVRADGKAMDFGWATLREVVVKWLLVGTLSIATGGLVYLVDVLWPLWDPENRALHDFVVSTRVVKA